VITLLQDNGYQVEINLDKDYSPARAPVTRAATFAS